MQPAYDNFSSLQPAFADAAHFGRVREAYGRCGCFDSRLAEQKWRLGQAGSPAHPSPPMSADDRAPERTAAPLHPALAAASAGAGVVTLTPPPCVIITLFRSFTQA